MTWRSAPPNSRLLISKHTEIGLSLLFAPLGVDWTESLAGFNGVAIKARSKLGRGRMAVRGSRYRSWKTHPGRGHNRPCVRYPAIGTIDDSILPAHRSDEA